MLTPWLIYHVASGQSFFSGVACLLAGVALSDRAKRRIIRVARNGLVALGGILVAASATPFPLWIYGIFLLISLVWIVGEFLQDRRFLIGVRVIMVAAWVIACGMEIPFHLMPKLTPLGRPTLGIVGDSITAGIDPGTRTWPKCFASAHNVQVIDHAVAGATVVSAMKQAKAISDEERLVLLEIGGNDLLGGTSVDDFDRGLDSLLAAVVRPGRAVIMLELPLPPGSNAFGRIQRRLASKYGILLIPKRVLLEILLQNGATLDSIHLSSEGHARMADVLWTALKDAFPG